MLFAIQIRVKMEEFAVIQEEGSSASVISAILGNTAKVSSNTQING